MRRRRRTTTTTTTARHSAGYARWRRGPRGLPRRGLGLTAIVAVFALVVATFSLTSASAATSAVHEITANWTGAPVPTAADFGSAVMSEWHINTNDANDPEANDPVNNVRVTLIAGNGVFASIPAVCKTTGATPPSSISTDGSTLVCNLGTVDEGTSTVVQAPIRVSGQTGGNLTATGSVTSDSAAAPAGPVSQTPLPIHYSHGMDLSLVQAPGSGYQGALKPSRLGGNRQFMEMNFSLILSAGSRPGPASYTFPLTVSADVAGATTGLQWEGCVPVSATSPSTGQPFSDPTQASHTNFPTCAVTGSGATYSVTVSNLTYTLINSPVKDSLGQPLASTGAYIASGTILFSRPTPVTVITDYTFDATAAGPFVFTDGVSTPDITGDNTSNLTLTPFGGFSDLFSGTPAASRTSWDVNLWVSPGTSQGEPLPIPGGSASDPASIAGSSIPLYMQANSEEWNGYTGAGGAQLAGQCSMNEDPSVFIMTAMDGGNFGATYEPMTTDRYFYTTATLSTKTETCGEAAPGPMWTEVPKPAGCAATDPRYESDCLMDLPPGVTAIKMTWNPAVDQPSVETYLRGFGHISPTAPTSGVGWTVGTYNYPPPRADLVGFPTLNGWVNESQIAGGPVIPGDTYGPGANANAIRDAFRLQGPQGVVTKSTPDTTAEPGVPVTYNITAEAQDNVTDPPPIGFPVIDTLPVGMVYVTGSGAPTPAVSTVGTQQVLTWTFPDNTPANVLQNITYQAETPAGSVLAPGTTLTNQVVINVTGDSRPVGTPGRQATATVVVPNSASTTLGKSVEDNVLSFYGDSSAWDLTINSQDPTSNPFTDTIDVLPFKGDAAGTNIDGAYTIGAVTAPAGSTVYYSAAAPGTLSSDPRTASNGTAPGSIAGNTVGWSTTKPATPTAIRILGPALAPGATQAIRIAFTNPAPVGTCVAPAVGDNKPAQKIVNVAESIAGHTGLPMLSSATTMIGACYALDVKKYVLAPGGNPVPADPSANPDWLDANAAAQYPQYVAGATVPFEVVATNKGTGALTNVVVSDPLVAGCGGTIASLAAGASSTFSCSMTAVVGVTVNTASASVTPPDGPPLTPTDPAGFVVPEPFQVTKSSVPVAPQAALPGGRVDYTITVTEPASSPAPFINPSLSDDLSGVEDDATYVAGSAQVSADAGAAGLVTVDGSAPANVVNWAGASLMPGQTVTITYSVKVNDPDTGDKSMVNTVVTPPGESNCSTPGDPTCTVTLLVPALVVSKSVDPATTTPVVEGQSLTYTVTFDNTAGKAAAPVDSTDDLSKVLDDAAVTTAPALATGAGLTVGAVAAGTFAVTGSLAAGATATVTYAVTVDTPDTGDHALTNFVVPTGVTPPADCVAGDTTCTTNPVPDLVVSKSVDPVTTTPVAEGQVLTYTLTFDNTVGKAPAAVNSTDDLSKVIDDAAVTTAPALATGTGLTVGAVTGGMFAVTGMVAAGQTATVTYQVTVNTPDTGDHALTNFVVPTGTTPPTDCVAGDPTCTTNPVPDLVVSKSVDPTTTTPVVEGQILTYTLTFDNTAGKAPAAVSETDDLSKVLDDAAVTTAPALATGAGLIVGAVTGGAFAVTGSVAAGATATVTYQVTVNTPDVGDHAVTNFVVPTGTTPPTDCVAGDPTCTTNPVPDLVVSKSVDPATTTPVAEGQVLTYTLTFDNTAGKAPATVNETDDLSKVVDDAAVTTAPALATGTGLTVGAVTGGTFTITGTLAAGATATVTYQVTVNTPDTGDHALTNFVVPTGVTPPADCVTGDTTCTTNPVPALVVSKSVDPVTTTPVVEGQVLTYTLSFDNSAGKAPAVVSETDDLSKVLDDATVTTAPALATGAGLTVGAVTGGTFTITGTLAAGATATVTYQVTVDTPDVGDHALTNFVVPTGVTPPADCVAGDPTCTTNPVPDLVVSKSVDPATTTPVAEGQVLTYTLTFDNTAGKAPAAVNSTDDLSKVIDDAAVTTAPALATGTGLTVGSVTGGTFAVTGSVAAGQTATVTYTVTVNIPDTGDHALTNFVVPTGVTPPADCVAGDPTCTTNPVPDLVVSKSVDPATTTPVVEGQILTYTLTFDNTAGKAAAAVSETDDLSKVVDDATVTAAPALATGTGLAVGAVSGGTFAITGSLPAGMVATVTYQVTVNIPDVGDHALTNFVVPTGVTPPTDCVAGDPTCTTNPVPDLVVSKSVDPATTTPVVEGQVLTYTLTFDNTVGKAPAAVNSTDDLSKVIDDAAVTTAPALATGTGLTVGAVTGGTFTITGTLAAGATATVTYQVTVNTPDTGDHALTNFVVPTGVTPPADCVTGDTTCTTNPVPALVVSKGVDPVTTSPVVEGQVLTYTLTFANTAGKASAVVNETDDLSKVLDDATVTTAPVLATGAGLTVGAVTGGTFAVTGSVAAGQTATVTYQVTVNTPDTGDHALTNFVVPTGVTPPADCVVGDPTCTTNPVPALVVSKSVDPVTTSPVVEGQVLTYTLTFDNTAGKAPAAVNSTDDLSKVLDDAAVTAAPALATGTGLTVGSVTGGAFTITGMVAAGTTTTVTYSVTVDTPDVGDHQLDNFVVPTGVAPPTDCVVGDTSCTTNPVPGLVVSKSVDPATTTPVVEGQVLTYTVTFDNSTGKAPAVVDETDDLSKVLDDAVVTTAPALATGTGLTVGAVTGGTFAVTGSVAAGAQATVTYTVTVDQPDVGDHDLLNFVVPTGVTPPADCVAGNVLCTENPVPALVVSKSVSPVSGTTVVPGQVVTYTLTFTNVGKGSAVVDYTDTLTGPATQTSIPTVSPGLVVAQSTANPFTVTGAVTAGQVSTVTYTVTIDPGAVGMVDNFILPTGVTPPAQCVSPDPSCTSNPISALVVSKSVSPKSGTVVAEGQVLTYTLTFDNSRGTGGAVVDSTDDLTRVLDDAAVTTAPALATGTGLAVSGVASRAFAVTGSVAAASVATVTYAVTVNTPDTGDHDLLNFVVPTGVIPPTSCVAGDPLCTDNLVPVPVLQRSGLAFTGFPLGQPLSVAGVLLLLGCGLLVGAKRRRRTRV